MESSEPFGTHVVDCVSAVDPIPYFSRGSICVDAGGLNVCDPAIAVEPTTWGRIKSMYR